MGKNNRNVLRKGVMRNFSNYTMERYILIDNDTIPDDNQKDEFVKKINEILWYAIQETNIRAQGRILPFLIVRRVYKENNQVRVVINDSNKEMSDFPEIKDLKPEEFSHIVNFIKLPPQRRIMISNWPVQNNAKMIVAENDDVAAAVDIFLDIAMFHSYSFLSSMSIDDKKEFNQIKIDFFNDNNLKCYYLIDPNNLPTFYSFAFSAREQHDVINFDQYISIWNKFINKYYPTEKTTIASPVEQITYHTDIGNLNKQFLSSAFWATMPKGDYLLLRTNQRPNTEERRDLLCDYFAISNYYDGAIKLVPINEYYTPFIFQNLQELIISAYKIVI